MQVFLFLFLKKYDLSMQILGKHMIKWRLQKIDNVGKIKNGLALKGLTYVLWCTSEGNLRSHRFANLQTLAEVIEQSVTGFSQWNTYFVLCWLSEQIAPSVISLNTFPIVTESAVFIMYTRSVNSFGVSGCTPDFVFTQISVSLCVRSLWFKSLLTLFSSCSNFRGTLWLMGSVNKFQKEEINTPD